MKTTKVQRAKGIWRDRQGSMIVIVALLMAAVMAASALVVDYGMVYIKTTDIQNAADAASLAAGRLLPMKATNTLEIDRVKQEAISYAMKNGITSISAENVTLGDLYQGAFTSVNVQVASTVTFFFAKVFGINSINVVRNARAKVLPSTRIFAPNPLGVDITQLRNAIANGNIQNIVLKYGAGDTEVTNGSFGAIDLDGLKGGGASDYASWLRYGFNGELSIGDNLLPVEKGDMAGPTYDALSQRYDACTHFLSQGGCTLEHFEPNCPRVLKVLVTEKVGTSYVKVKGFAAFVLSSETLATPGRIVGSYINMIEPGLGAGETTSEDINFGIYSLSLSN